MRHSFIVWNIISWFLLSVTIVLLFLFVGVRLFGLQPYIITSASMSPEYETGSMIYVKKVSIQQLKKGETITFFLDAKETATHKIYDIDQKNQVVYTFGINNLDENGQPQIDPRPVQFKDIIGTPIFCIPFIGKIYYIITTSPGVYFITLLCIFMTSVSIVLDNKSNCMRRKVKKHERK